MSSARASSVSSTLVVFTVLLLGRLGGLLRELIVAPLFGAGAEVDALVAARTVPDLILIVLTSGTVNSAVVPALSHLSAGQDDVRDESWRAVSIACNWLLVLALSITIPGLLFPRQFMAIVTPGLDTTRAVRSAELLRIMLPMAILATMGAILGAFLNYRERFGLPSSRAAITNVSIIVITLLLWRTLGITSVAIGWLIGALLQFLVLIPLAFRSKVRYKLSLDYRVPGVKHVWRLMLPILVSQLLLYGRYLVERRFASWLPEGSLAQLNYAYRISAMPWLVLANSVTTVYVTTFSKQAADNDLSGLSRSLAQSLRIIAMGIVPCVVIFVSLAQPTVQILYQRGAFEASDTLATARLLRWYGVSLLASSVVALFSQLYYSIQDGITPAVALGVGVVLQWISTALLIPRSSTVGVVIGICIGLFSTATILYIALKNRLPEIKNHWSVSVLARILCAGVGMLLVCAPLYGVSSRYLPTWPYWMRYSVSIGLGAITYLAIIWFFRVPEISLLVTLLRQRFGKAEEKAP